MVNIRRLKNKSLAIIYIVVIFIFATGVWQQNEMQHVNVFAMPTTGRVIIIDAGHGGWDS